MSGEIVAIFSSQILGWICDIKVAATFRKATDVSLGIREIQGIDMDFHGEENTI